MFQLFLLDAQKCTKSDCSFCNKASKNIQTRQSEIFTSWFKFVKCSLILFHLNFFYSRVFFLELNSYFDHWIIVSVISWEFFFFYLFIFFFFFQKTHHVLISQSVKLLVLMLLFIRYESQLKKGTIGLLFKQDKTTEDVTLDISKSYMSFSNCPLTFAQQNDKSLITE